MMNTTPITIETLEQCFREAWKRQGYELILNGSGQPMVRGDTGQFLKDVMIGRTGAVRLMILLRGRNPEDYATYLEDARDDGIDLDESLDTFLDTGTFARSPYRSPCTAPDSTKTSETRGGTDMEFRLQIRSGNVAMTDDTTGELQRILGDVSARIGNGERDGTCRDVNGNRVGDWWIETEDQDDDTIDTEAQSDSET